MKRNCRVLSEIYDRCKQWSKMHDIKFSMTKHELIHFMRISKWFNMKVDVELMKHQINLKSDIRVLKVQLNFKLKWVIHMHQLLDWLSQYNHNERLNHAVCEALVASSSLQYEVQSLQSFSSSLWSYEVIISEQLIFFRGARLRLSLSSSQPSPRFKEFMIHVLLSLYEYST